MKGRVASCFIFISQKKCNWQLLQKYCNNLLVRQEFARLKENQYLSSHLICTTFKIAASESQCVQFQISPRNELKWKNDVIRGSIDRADNLWWGEVMYSGAAHNAAQNLFQQNFFLTRLRGSIDTWSATKTLGSKSLKFWKKNRRPDGLDS